MTHIHFLTSDTNTHFIKSSTHAHTSLKVVHIHTVLYRLHSHTFFISDAYTHIHFFTRDKYLYTIFLKWHNSLHLHTRTQFLTRNKHTIFCKRNTHFIKSDTHTHTFTRTSLYETDNVYVCFRWNGNEELFENLFKNNKDY